MYEDLWHKVFTFLDFYDHFTVAIISKRFNRCIKSNGSWDVLDTPQNKEKEMIQFLKNNGIYLETLNMFYCINYNDFDTCDLVQVGNSIKYLDLTWCMNLTDETVRLIGQHMPKLNSLILDKCDQITGKYVKDLPDSLEYLNMSHCSAKLVEHMTVKCLVMTNCPVSDNNLRKLLDGCKQLEQLYLDNNTKITDRSLNTLSYNKTIRLLSLSQCQNITDVGLFNLMINKTIKELHLGGTRITDDGLDFVARMNVERLLLCSCYNITTTGLYKLSESSKKIKQVDVYNCMPQLVDTLDMSKISFELLC